MRAVFFPVFLENDLLKVNKILGLTFFKARKDFNARGRRRLTSSNRAAILSSLHARNDTTNLFDYKPDESTENNKALLLFSGKEAIQTFNGSI